MASAFARMEEAEVPFDVVHDNCGFTAFAFADRIDTPLVHTLHGPFTDETKAFYARHAYKARAVALSRYQAEQAPAELDIVAVIGNPIVVADFPFRRGQGRLRALDRPDQSRTRGRTAPSRPRARPACSWCSPGPVQPGNEEFFAKRGRAAHRRRSGGVRRRGGGGEGRAVRGRRAPSSCRSGGRSRSGS